MLLEHAFDNTPAGLALIDASGHTVRVNPAMAALLERDEATIREHGLQQVLGEGTASTSGSALVLARADGSTTHVRVTLVPLIGADGETSGVLAQLLDIGDREAVAARERTLVAELAEVRAIAARQLADLRRVVAVQRALGDDADVREAVCDAALEIGGALMAVVFERDGDEWLRSTATAGLDDTRFDLRTDQPSGVAQVFATGEPLTVADVSTSSTVSQVLVARVGVGSVLFQPVQRDGETVAVLALGWRAAGHTPEERIVTVAELLAADLAVGLRRAEHYAALEAATSLDPETGLLNPHGWDGALYLELERSRRLHDSVCVAVMELPEGTSLTARIADWRRELRGTDALARMADDRVAVLLPGCELPKARLVVERLQPGGAHGVVQWDGSESPARLMDRADRHLYQSLAHHNVARLSDPQRLASVNAVIAAGDQPLLHELAQAAATAVDANAVAVTLVGDQEQTFAGQHGIEGWAEYGTPIAYSYCQYPTVTGRPFIVENAREHPLVADNPAVEELEAIAYAGIPLHDAEGRVLGALCAIETNPRIWQEADVDVLTRFAELASTELQRVRRPAS